MNEQVKLISKSKRGYHAEVVVITTDSRGQKTSRTFHTNWSVKEGGYMNIQGRVFRSVGAPEE